MLLLLLLLRRRTRCRYRRYRETGKRISNRARKQDPRENDRFWLLLLLRRGRIVSVIGTALCIRIDIERTGIGSASAGTSNRGHCFRWCLVGWRSSVLLKNLRVGSERQKK